MNNKKIVFGILLVFILLFGCTTTTQNVKPIDVKNNSYTSTVDSLNVSKNNTKVSLSSYITITDNNNVQKVTISSFKEGEKWAFPMQEYPKQFEKVGLFQEYYLRLTNKQMNNLQEDEEIWLTIYAKGNAGVLFNAIYSQNLSEDCSDRNVTILGKTYDLSKSKTKQSLENDDKWKIAYEYKDYTNLCKTKAIVYLDGYFERLEEGEQVNLFRNDNSIILSFKDLKSLPKVEIVYTKSSDQNNKIKTISEQKIQIIQNIKTRLYYNQSILINNIFYTFCGYSVSTEPNLRMQVSLCEFDKKYKGTYLPVGLNTSVNNRTVFIENLNAIDITKNQTKNESYINMVVFNN